MIALYADLTTHAVADRFEQHLPLEPHERRFLERLDVPLVEYSTSETLRVVNEPVGTFYLVEAGWLFASRFLRNGSRHIAEHHLTGDLVGFRDLAFGHAVQNVAALTPSLVWQFELEHLRALWMAHPRLGALLLSLVTRTERVLAEYGRVITRMPSTERVYYFYLTILHRLRSIGAIHSDVLSLPFDQRHLGDFIGLTNVSVSKCVGELEARGWIMRRRDGILIRGPASANRTLDFEDCYAELDTSWFPASAR